MNKLLLIISSLCIAFAVHATEPLTPPEVEADNSIDTTLIDEDPSTNVDSLVCVDENGDSIFLYDEMENEEIPCRGNGNIGYAIAAGLGFVFLIIIGIVIAIIIVIVLLIVYFVRQNKKKKMNDNIPPLPPC